MLEYQTTCQDYHINFEYFEYFLEIYYKMFLIIFGCMGNSMTIIIFWRTKLARSLRSSFYLISLAISDIAMLLVLLLQYLDAHNLLPEKLSIKNSSIICKGSQYLGFVFNFVSCGLVLAFTVQRLVIIVFPLRVHGYTMESKSKIFVFIIVLIGCVLYSYYLNIYDIVYDVVQDNMNRTSVISHCWTKKGFEETAEIFAIVDSVITLIFPFLGLLIMNAIIIKTLKVSSHTFSERPGKSKSMKISFKKIDNNQIVDQRNSNTQNNISSNNNSQDYNIRRNSSEIQSLQISKALKKNKKILASYKLDKFSKLGLRDKQNSGYNEDSCISDNTHATNSRFSSFRNSKGEHLLARFNANSPSKRKGSSLRLSNGGMNIHISNPKTAVSRKITKMLIIVSSTFLLLNLPVHSFNLYIYVVMQGRPEHEKMYNCVENYLRVICYHLFFTSFSCNFLLYSISGVMFRNECKKLIFQIFRINRKVV